jgi:phage tail sheath protein FI
MPVRPTYPGVYVEEIPSGVHVITGVSTSVAAFLGTFPMGLLDRAVQLFGVQDFEREYGGLDSGSETSYAIQQFFLNGGTECFVVRVADTTTGPKPAAASSVVIPNGFTPAVNMLSATAGRSLLGQPAGNPGSWGDSLRIEIDYAARSAAIATETNTLFNATVSLIRVDGDRTVTVAAEKFTNLSLSTGPDNVVDTVNEGSTLVQLAALAGATANVRPAANGTVSGPYAAGALAPAGATALSVILMVNGAALPGIALAIPATAAPRRLSDWATGLQTAIRAASSTLPLPLQPYLADATVEIVGDNTAISPARMAIRAGRSARPFDPGATLTFTGAGLTAYLLDPAAATVTDRPSIAPQLFALSGGQNGLAAVGSTFYRGVRATKTGLFALEDVDLFNILCIPDAPLLQAAGAADPAGMRALYTDAEVYCDERRAMVIVDIAPDIVRLDQMQAWLADNATLRDANAAVYYPRTQVSDPLNRGRLRSVSAGGTIAGLYARTDTARGVWKAPAGTDARLRGVQALDYVMTDRENGALNPLGINCLRTFPVYSSICWGARTLDGADQIASDWKYVPVRRTTLFLEESLYRGTQWVVFEPNDEPLWSQIRLNVGAFMQDLFRKGAFQGATPRDAYYVHCDSSTTTQIDIDSGIVNIEVGFAPLKPAEFVILQIRQIARTADA